MFGPLVGQQQSAFIAQADSLIQLSRQHYKDSSIARPNLEQAAKLSFPYHEEEKQWLSAVTNLAYHFQYEGELDTLIFHIDSCLNHISPEHIDAGNVEVYGALIVYYVYALEQTADYQTLFEAVNDAVLILRQRYIAPSLINYIIYPQLYDFQARAAYRLGDELLAVNLADSVIWYHRQQATSADSASIKSHHLAIARIFRTKQTSLAKLGRYQEVLRQSKEIIALSIQDSALVGSILNNLGFAQLQIGRADSSRFYAEQALSIYQKLLSRPKADSNRLL
ncbi:MAG: hypothetical protein AAFQ68_20080, partial [Bacteroidota bacterium]